MIVNGRDILFHTQFLSDVRQAETYIEKRTSQASKEFVKELELFVFDKIPFQPFAFPEFQLLKTAGKVFRKAIFRKKWNVVYKVQPTEILFVALYHAKRDVQN